MTLKDIFVVKVTYQCTAEVIEAGQEFSWRWSSNASFKFWMPVLRDENLLAGLVFLLYFWEKPLRRVPSNLNVRLTWCLKVDVCPFLFRSGV